MALNASHLRPWRTVHLSSKLIAALAAVYAVVLIPGALLPAPVLAEQWKDSECGTEVDSGGETIKVCDDGYHMAVFWNDGSYVNGACTTDGTYDVKYSGISKSDAIAWVKDFCGD